MWTDRRTVMTKLIVAFRNYAKAPNKWKLKKCTTMERTQRIDQNADFLVQPSAL